MSESLKSEIEYVKSLAEAGDVNELAVASLILFAGLCFFIPNFALTIFIALEQFEIIKSVNATDVSPILSYSIVFVFIFAPIFLLFRKIELSKIKLATAQMYSGANKAANSVWSAVLVAAIFYIIAQILIMTIAKIENSNTLKDTIDNLEYFRRPVLFLLIGVGWWVTSSVSKFSKLRIAAYCCFIMVPIAIYVCVAYPSSGADHNVLIATGFRSFSTFILLVLPALYMVTKKIRQ